MESCYKEFDEEQEQSDSCSLDLDEDFKNDNKYDLQKSYLDFGLVDYQS